MNRVHRRIAFPAIQGGVSPSLVRGGDHGGQGTMRVEAEDGYGYQVGGIAFRRFALFRREGLCFPRRFPRLPSPGSRWERALPIASPEPGLAFCE